MRQHGPLERKRILIVGDILHSRVARSNWRCLTLLGAKVVFCGPPTLVPGWGVRELGAEGEPPPRPGDGGRGRGDDAARAARAADRIHVPVRSRVRPRWGLTAARAERLAGHVKVLHPGPINRGVEIASEVADGPRSVILEQVHQRRGGPDGRPGGARVKPICSRADESWTPPSHRCGEGRAVEGRPRGRDSATSSRTRLRRSSTRKALGSSRGSSTSTCTCASRAKRTRRPSLTGTPRGGRGRLHRRRARCPTPARSTTARRHGAGPRERAAVGAVPRATRSGAITKGLKGEELTEMGELNGRRLRRLTDDGRPVMSAALMRRALEYAEPSTSR